MTPPPLFGPMTLIQHFFLAGFPYQIDYFIFPCLQVSIELNRASLHSSPFVPIQRFVTFK